MPITISQKTKKVLLEALKMDRLVEIMDRDYADLNEDHDVDREKAVCYASRNRGSIRINTGRFYTIKEYAHRVERAKRLKLP